MNSHQDDQSPPVTTPVHRVREVGLDRATQRWMGTPHETGEVSTVAEWLAKPNTCDVRHDMHVEFEEDAQGERTGREFVRLLRYRLHG